jgi:hypothetical protein
MSLFGRYRTINPIQGSVFLSFRHILSGKNLKSNMREHTRKNMMKKIGTILRMNGNLLRKPSCARHIGRNLATSMLTRNGSGGQTVAFSRISACLPGWRRYGFLARNIRI